MKKIQGKKTPVKLTLWLAAGAAATALIDAAVFTGDASAFAGTPPSTPIAMSGTVGGRGLVGSIGYRLRC